MITVEEARKYSRKCLRCGTCKYVFGLYSPSCPAGDRFSFEGFYSSGKHFVLQGIVEGRLDPRDPGVVRALYSCTLCGNCATQCPLAHGEHNTDVFEALRAMLVEAGAGPLPEHKPLLDSIDAYGNPWLQPRKNREKWMKGRGVRTVAEGRAPVLYFVGCTAAFDPAARRMAENTVKILEAAGVDYAVLGREEGCCGSTLLRLGLREKWRGIAEKNLETWRATGAETIVTSCAGCYKTLSGDYPAVGSIGAEVLHISQFLDRLFAEGRLGWKRPAGRSGGGKPLRVTYHDPCHLGRYAKVYEAPRRIIGNVPGVELVEMRRNRENSWCCGAGGGVRTAFPEWAAETASKRLAEARTAGADVIASACPFCLQNLDAVAQAEGGIKFMDLTDLVAGAVEAGRRRSRRNRLWERLSHVGRSI